MLGRLKVPRLADQAGESITPVGVTHLPPLGLLDVDQVSTTQLLVTGSRYQRGKKQRTGSSRREVISSDDSLRRNSDRLAPAGEMGLRVSDV
jgi:hypothetical protein